MSDDADEAVELVVHGAEKRDAGRGIARLPERARRTLGVLSGDTVIVEGSTTTVAKVWPARGSLADDGVQIDADTRGNAGVRIGETVRLRGVDVDDASVVTVVAPGRVTDPDALERHVRRELQGRPVHEDERLHLEHLSDDAFVVESTKPDGLVRVTGETKVFVRTRGVDSGRGVDTSSGSDAGGSSNRPGDASDDRTGGDADRRQPRSESGGLPDLRDGAASAGADTGVSYEDIGGLDDELELVREMIELPLSEPEVFAHLGVDPPKGVLLHGPPGTGKTLIAKAVANEVNASFHSVSGPEIMSKYKGDSEENLRRIFRRASDDAPAIIFFDEIDSIAPKRDDDGDAENRIVGQLLSLMDGLDARGDVVVIGATNRVDSLDPALRRGGRFDREIEIGVPNEAGRREILEVHSRRMPLAEDVELPRLAARTHGFVGADLESLTTEAAMAALRRGRRESVALGDLQVTRGDFETALSAVDPSAMREYVAEKPTEGFEAVGGLDDAKATLERAVTWPLQYAPLFEAAGTSPPTGVLLHGPPGTGKTLLARALAAESGVNFIHVAGPELLDRYVGESEKSVREVFERARQTAPCIVLFDEIDAIASRRDGGGDSDVTERVVSQLLTELDRAAKNPSLVVLAATNRRDALDPALLRPGRLETHIEVPNPDEAARRAILDVHTRGKPIEADVDFDALAARTGGYSGAELESLCREAAMRAITAVTERYEGATANEHADEVRIRGEHFEAALTSLSRHAE